MPQNSNTVYLGLGANMGDPLRQLQQAIAAIAALPATQILATSSFYRSPPLEADGDDYTNAVLAIRTDYQPLALLQALQTIEQQAGRQRPYRNAPRTLDLDILLWQSGRSAAPLHMDSPELTLPHPRMGERAFVLLPLQEIAPHLVDAQALPQLRWQNVEKKVEKKVEKIPSP